MACFFLILLFFLTFFWTIACTVSIVLFSFTKFHPQVSYYCYYYFLYILLWLFILKKLQNQKETKKDNWLYPVYNFLIPVTTISSLHPSFSPRPRALRTVWPAGWRSVSLRAAWSGGWSGACSRGAGPGQRCSTRTSSDRPWVAISHNNQNKLNYKWQSSSANRPVDTDHNIGVKGLQKE